MEDKNNAFVLYTSYADILTGLSMEDMGHLFKAILEYKKNGLEITLPAHLVIIFRFIKNQLDMDSEKYQKKVEKLKANGFKGGRPKKQEKPNGFSEEEEKPNGFFENHNVNVNVNDNVNVNVNDNVSFLNKKENDPFVNSTKKVFSEEYEKVFNAKPFLSNQDCIKLSELKSEHENFVELIPIALNRLKAIEFKDINFTPTASWLLKGNNFERVMNDEFKVKTDSDWLEKALEKCNEYT